ncbi:GSCOCG00010769001-RA-CDS [Cotesia congregata]|uniref:Conserved oligomeric Golgi complex subunit 6 n=1 Tax=Cotesia congregata TaxID=51543 RepID=A0A8J2H9P2_COTCN|nr:GSCOCG00010769001-RA-CDS [Cotesia congregata]CAG5084705.1 Similar to Cog6: Conserved oligomeric Golgi complex subunit 6 (Drosophila melanogaster) [Cotesia congregata]
MALTLEKNQNTSSVKRVNNLLESRPENDKEALEALKELSTFFTDNTLNARRNLSSNIEKRSLVINDEFLSIFREVKSTLDDIHSDVLSMNNSIQSMTNRLHTTKAQTITLIDRTTKLQNESKKLSMQHDVAQAFIKTFQLTKYEIRILHGLTREEPITEEFFTVITRLQTIHTSCRTLMQSGYQTLGLDVMQRMTLLQEAALERLYRWTQNQCRHIENECIAPLLIKAMNKLQERPILFKYIIDEYCTARRSIIVGSFIDALTLGSTSGGSRNPIKLRADDPTRYIGDMLAWLHQAIPIEKENLLTLLKTCDKTDISDQVKLALGNITEELCHPLKSRVEHILAVDASASVFYSVIALIRYYLKIFNDIIPESAFIKYLYELLELNERNFISKLQREAQMALGERPEPPGQDLVPAASVSKLLTSLNEILSIALIVTGDDREKDIIQIVSYIIDPLLHEIDETAARLPVVDMAVYLLNCLNQIHSTLSLYEYMDQRLERLQAQSDAQIDTLTSEIASSLVANLNLGPIYTILQGKEHGPLSGIPGLDALSVKEFNNKLESFLLMPDSFLLPQINLLKNCNHRSTVLERSFQVIGAIYKQLYEACHDPKNQYENPDKLFVRTPDQLMEKLLSQ